MKRNPTLSAFAVIAIAGVGIIAAGIAPANATTGGSPAVVGSATPISVADDTEPVYTGAPNQLTLPLTPDQFPSARGWSAAKDDVTVQLDPGTIALCNVGFGDVSIKRYTTPTEGDIDLFCGNSSAGYIHIREGKQKSWQAQIDGLGGGPLWDDWMEYQLNAAVTTPGPGYPLSIGGQKSCYSTPIQLFEEESGTLFATFYPTIITSQNRSLVITAIPTTTKTANNCKEGIKEN